MSDEVVEKVAYSSQYQDARGIMIFRYDNAAHRPTLAVLAHKHDLSGVKPTETPNREQALAELVEKQPWI